MTASAGVGRPRTQRRSGLDAVTVLSGATYAQGACNDAAECVRRVGWIGSSGGALRVRLPRTGSRACRFDPSGLGLLSKGIDRQEAAIHTLLHCVGSRVLGTVDSA